MKVRVWAHTSTQVGGAVGCHFSCSSLVCACGGCGGIISHGAEGVKEKLIFQPFIVALVPVPQPGRQHGALGRGSLQYLSPLL